LSDIIDIIDIIAISSLSAIRDINDIRGIIAISSLRALRDIIDIITATEWLPAGVLHWIGIPAPLDCCSVGLLSRGPRGSWRRCRRRGGWLDAPTQRRPGLQALEIPECRAQPLTLLCAECERASSRPFLQCRFAEIGEKGVAPCSIQLVPYTWMRSAEARDVHKEECHRMV
jgi:hypothetical protein